MRAFMRLPLACLALAMSATAAAKDLVLDCGAVGVITGIDGFKVVKMPEGNIVRGTGGEVRTFPDGVRMSAVPYTDGSVLYTKATPPAAFFFQKPGGPMVKCAIP